MQEIIKLAVADVLPQAQLKQIDLGLANHQEAWVRGQPEALRMLLRNLLDNAIKYTPASGQVDVSIKVLNGQAWLAVEDSGPGIAPDERSRVFDRFFRAGDALAETGSGLGLAIVKAIADRHDAILQLDQSPRLGGLRVEMRMALAAPAASTAG